MRSRCDESEGAGGERDQYARESRHEPELLEVKELVHLLTDIVARFLGSRPTLHAFGLKIDSVCAYRLGERVHPRRDVRALGSRVQPHRQNRKNWTAFTRMCTGCQSHTTEISSAIPPRLARHQLNDSGVKVV